MSELIHFGAVGISMIVSVLLGFVWYGPFFGKKWVALSGIVMPEKKPEMSVMIKPIILSLVGAFFMSFVLSFLIEFHDAYYMTSGFIPALSMALLVWLGFIVPVYFNLSGWEEKPWTLFFINAGYWLVFLMISASVITMMGM